MYLREDMADIRVSLNGTPLFGSWATASGGALESDDQKTRPGGMGHEVSVGGHASRGDITATTQLTDHVVNAHDGLERQVGNGSVKVSWTFLGRDRIPTGKSHTRVGTLKAAKLPDATSGSSAQGMYEIIVSCNELAA